MDFRCPNTGQHIQQWIIEDDARADEKRCTYEAVNCPACTRLHFINRSTGKLLGHERSLSRSRFKTFSFILWIKATFTLTTSPC